MNNHYTPLSFNAMLAVCVGLCGCQFQNSFFLFRAGQSFNHFFHC